MQKSCSTLGLGDDTVGLALSSSHSHCEAWVCTWPSESSGSLKKEASPHHCPFQLTESLILCNVSRFGENLGEGSLSFMRSSQKRSQRSQRRRTMSWPLVRGTGETEEDQGGSQRHIEAPSQDFQQCQLRSKKNNMAQGKALITLKITIITKRRQRNVSLWANSV